ncbi:MAG: deoxynucleoside kinase [Saprospiraceae bacterium]|nr:deoxynucleoside kinase [Saprospiraceae bacterium]
MSPNPFPYRFIAIEGNIGSGKTTLCHKLADLHGCDLVLEQFTDNPFLPFFYENPERYAFPVELFFMTERHKQLQEHFAAPDLFSTFTVADYFFLKTSLFARNNLNETEFRLFQRLFQVLNASFPKPELLVYLHRPVEVLLEQIEKRGRDMEKYITAPYLESLQNAYFDFFKSQNDIPVLLIELDRADYVNTPEVFEAVCRLLAQPYPAGLNVVTLPLP